MTSVQSRGGRPGLPVPNSLHGLCGRKATLNCSISEVRNCVKVEVAVLGSPSLIVLFVSVDVKQHWRVHYSALALACRWVQTRDVWYEIHHGRQKTGLVHVHSPTRRDRKCRDWINPLNDLGLFQRFWFPRREFLEVIDEFNVQYLVPTQESLSAVVDEFNVQYLVPTQESLSAVVDEFNVQYLVPTQESLSAVVDDDVGLHVLWCRVDIWGTNCKTVVGSWSCICTANRGNLLGFPPFSPKNLKLPRIAQETRKRSKRKLFIMRVAVISIAPYLTDKGGHDTALYKINESVKINLQK